MAIHTIHDINARPAPPLSPALERVTAAEAWPHSFSLGHAVHLKLKLQALDRAVSSIRQDKPSEADIVKIDHACQTPIPQAGAYVTGSETFYLLVKGLDRPHGIADAYAEAHKNVLQGRPHVNKYELPGWSGSICIFSEVRPLLHDIDRLCATNLLGAFAQLEERAQPFPFLRLPAELRLHVYSFLLRSDPRIILRTRRQPTTRPRLNIMRANKQLHNELRKYFYTNQRLLIPVCTSLIHIQPNFSYYSRTIATINPATLELLKDLEFQFRTEFDRHARSSDSWMSGISNMLGMLKLERIHITFMRSHPSRLSVGPALVDQDAHLERLCRLLIDLIPASVHISWSREDAAAFFRSTGAEQRLYHAIQERASSGADQLSGVSE